MLLMKHKWKIILCLICVLFATCALAACTYEFDPSDTGYTVTVIYDANGGRFGSSDGNEQREFRYKPAVTIIEPGGTQNNQVGSPVYSSRHVMGWYAAVLGDDLKPLKNQEDEYVDENGASIFEGEAWNFAEDKLPDEDGYTLYLVARWAMNYKLTVDVGEEARAAGLKNVEYTTYTEPGPLTRPYLESRDNYSWAGHTLFSCITSDGREIVTSEDWATLEFSDDNPEITVTVRWLEGEWDIIQTTSELSSMKSSGNYILATDIDMLGRSFSLTNFRGVLDGNGNTISNFKNTGNAVLSDATEWGAFSFMMGGYIKNVTFKNCTYSLTLSKALTGEDSYYAVGFIAGNGSSISNLEDFTNIGFENCTLDITKQGRAAQETILTGSGSYAGIFGELAEGQSFTPLEGSTVNVNIKVG